MTAEHSFERGRDFPDRRLGAGRFHGGGEQIAALLRRRGETGERRLGLLLVALRLQPCQLLDLAFAHALVVYFQDVDLGVARDLVLVDADDRLASGVDARLRPGGGLLDAHLRYASGDGLGHAAERFDFADVLERTPR